MVFSSGLRLCSFLACLLALAGGVPVRADVVVPPNTVRVPVATPAQAEAVRGFPVEIRLQGVTASPRMLQFILRQPPRHGRLEGPPVQAGKDAAVVRYVGNPSSKAETDTFSFAVKVEGSGSSEDALVTIRLTDPVAVLEAPGGVDLGRILATESVEQTIQIANKGNAPFKAAVPVPDGWSWLVPANGQFDLPPGEQIEAKLMVRVKEAGPIDQKVLLRPGSVVRFIGQAVEPFLGYPTLQRLQWDRKAGQRSSRLHIRNNRPEPLTVRLSGPTGVVVPESVTVPVAESAEVMLVCPGDVSKVLSGRIRLEAPGWGQDVSFEAPAAPAAVEVTGAAADGTVDFGVLKITEEVKAERQITLRNVGGMPSLVRWDRLRYFLVEGMESDTVLAPQAQRQIIIRPRPDQPGRLKEDLTLNMAGGDYTLKLLADIDPKTAQAALMTGQVLEVRPPTPPGTPEVKGPRSEEGRRARVQLLTAGLLEEPPNMDRSLATVNTIRPLEIGTDRLVFEWDAPSPGAWTYQVRVRQLRNHGPGQAPIPEYDQMDNVKVTSTPTGGRAEVTKLRPQVRWSCRIIGIRSDGVSTKPGEEMTFLTAPVPDSRWGWRVMGVLGALVLALYVRQKWREDIKWKD